MAVTAAKVEADMEVVPLLVAMAVMPVATVVEPQQVDMGEDPLVEVVTEAEQNQKVVMEKLLLEVMVVVLQLADMEEVVVAVDMVEKQPVDMVVTPVVHLVDMEVKPAVQLEDMVALPVDTEVEPVAQLEDMEEHLVDPLGDMEEQPVDHLEDTEVELVGHPEDTVVDRLEVVARSMLFS